MSYVLNSYLLTYLLLFSALVANKIKYIWQPVPYKFTN